jgi:hypothetical protein
MMQSRIRTHSRSPVLFQFAILLLVTLFTPVTVHCEEWVTQLDRAESFTLDPEQTAFLFYQNSLHLVTLERENLVIFKPSSPNHWDEKERFIAPDAGFSAFTIYDIQHDKTPEIIVGTREPGFLYIYQLSTDGKWQSRNYGKYLWSSVRLIIVGRFNSDNEPYLLVQNFNGMLFLLHKTEQSLDLIWQSPNPWRLITDFRVADLDNDQRDEIFVLYQNSGFAILKMTGNTIAPVFENFPWGRILALTVGDWGQDQLPEVIFSTSQKLLYTLGFNEKEKIYRIKEENSRFNFIMERIFLTKENEQSRLLASDSYGKLHFYEQTTSNHQWQELFSVQTGRIGQIHQTLDNRFWLLSSGNRQLFSLTFCPISKLRLTFSGTEYPIEPELLNYESKYYLSLRALGKIAPLNMIYNFDQEAIYMQLGERVVELIQRASWIARVNGREEPLLNLPLRQGNDLYLTLTDYTRLFGREFSLNAAQKLIFINNNASAP